MAVLFRLKRCTKLVTGRAFSALPVSGPPHPVFILGCGRSGTTIFGTALSKHPLVTYLNEPRHLWFAEYPQTDIWTPKAASRNGKLVLTAADAEPRKSEKLRRLFRFETLVARRPVLIEKLPINSFRVAFIREIFPDARFIHIYRNGLEVARSIANQAAKGGWFGADSYKWKQLVEHAQQSAETARLPGLCSNHFEMGLLEWRLVSEAISRSCRDLPPQTFFELSYDEWVQEPAKQFDRVLSFLGIGADAATLQFVTNNVVRKTGRAQFVEIGQKEREIGGRLLPFSFETNGLGQRAA